MKKKFILASAFRIAVLLSMTAHSNQAFAEQKALTEQGVNKDLVSKAMTELFVNRDVSAVERYWGSTYLQHNPTIADGLDDLPKVIKALPATFKYEPGVIVADGDLVMIHGRYTGWGPKPMVVVDIFRVKDGKLVEHWDVMQEEVPAASTKSGRPMFPVAPSARAGDEQGVNKDLVSKAMTELFVNRDVSAVERYWGSTYLQHNPTIADGLDDLPKVIKALPATFKYEPGVIVADGDLVMIHGRYTGWGPKPMVVVDIFRVKDGKLVEHWDVMQEEVPAASTKSGRPMFPVAPSARAGAKFPGTDAVYKADFGGDFVFHLTHPSAEEMTFVGQKGALLGVTETVKTTVTPVRPGVFIVSWQEKDKTTVVHVRDFEAGRVHTHITRPDGTFVRLNGTLTPVKR